ncbi:hypothetical protein RC1_2694 [Rhodospirillum centenum SW]|uniref:Uncharacterized protein n=1 Tax=Rhodospirillum centenum (strain ATCC 51521 / SW) TaxID=414684 RepID=B6IUY7_RHOCS|nr:hypothetical protein RC1_2694 [Rhodospirillum centenum SW]
MPVLRRDCPPSGPVGVALATRHGKDGRGSACPSKRMMAGSAFPFGMATPG